MHILDAFAHQLQCLQNMRGILKAIGNPELPLPYLGQIALSMHAILARNIDHSRQPVFLRPIHRRIARGAGQEAEERRRRMRLHIRKVT